MDQILNQLGGLLLGAVPTIIFFLLTWFLYNSLVHKKLMAVLAERKARTEGAMAKAKQDISAAEAKAAAGAQVKTARVQLEKEAADARANLQSQADTLAAAVIQKVLSSTSTAASAPVAGGAR